MSHAKQKVNAEERAWKLYVAQSDWIGKVDTKAAFVFGLQSALIGIVIAMTDEGKPFADFCHWWEVTLFLVGVSVLIVGVILAVLVIAPRLKAKAAKTQSATEFIYFGHLKHWKPADLSKELLEDDMLGALSRQLVVLARISATKHRYVQLSVWAFFIGGVLLLACLILKNLVGA